MYYHKCIITEMGEKKPPQKRGGFVMHKMNK